MKEKTSKTVRFYYGIIFGAFTVAVGALFIWQVLSVYLSGTAESFTGAHPFSRGRVLEALSKISLFFWLWIGGIVAGFVLWEVFPVKQKPRKICPDLQYARVIKRMPSSAPQGLNGEYGRLVQYKKLTFALKCAGWALFGAACVWGVIYLAIPSNFPKEDVTHEVLSFAKNVFPAVFAALLFMCATGAYEKFTVKKLLPVAQRVTKGQKPQPAAGIAAKIEGVLDNKYVVLGIRAALGVIAVALIIWGALNGNARAVFIKAINICTECIGLG